MLGYLEAQNTYGRLRGLALPEAVLNKVYVTNMERVLGEGI